MRYFVTQRGGALSERRARRRLPGMPSCPSCGAASPFGARFCPACGAPLSSAVALREERKVVTVLFADLVGFTSRADGLDPEDVRALARPFHELLRAEIERHGGTLARIVGDAGMAVFGYPAAHEDDPERAVRAAFALLAGLERLDEERPGLDLHARVGVNTSEAVVTYGSALEDADDLMGDGVNLAARLQGIAPADGIVVGESTYAATRRVFRYLVLDPVDLKGKPEPVAAYRPIGPIARILADQPDATPFVGRSRELGALADAFERSRGRPAMEIVTIVAEPGLGKSRLVRELRRHVDRLPDPVGWRTGRCLPYGDGVGFGALGEIVRSHAGILDSDDRATLEAKLGAALTEPDPDLRRWMADRIAPLIGLDASSEPPGREEAFAAWSRFVTSIAGTRPAILVVEDLHWADAAFVEFLERLATDAADLPLLLIATARPEVAERHPAWPPGGSRTTTIRLSPLASGDMAGLVAAALGGAPRKVRAAVLERAAGSPLYAEQLAAMLRDRGASDVGSLADGEVPASIHALLASRIDALPPEAKRLLLDASVVGKRFSSGAVAALAGRGIAAVEPTLSGLARRELVRPVIPSALTGETEYLFWNALVRDVAYGELTRGDRLTRHRAAAAWIAARARTAPGADAEVAASHLEQALELAVATAAAAEVPPIRSELVVALLGAAEYGMRTEVPRAVRALRRCLDLLGPSDDRRPEVLARLGRALSANAEFPGAVEVLDLAVHAHRARGDETAAAELAAARSVALSFAGEGDRARAVLEDARAALAAHPGPGLVAVVAEQAMAAMVASRLDRALLLADEAIDLARSLGLPPPHRALHARGWVRYGTDETAGEADFRAAIDGAIAAGAISSAGGAMQNLAIARGNERGPRAALDALDEAIAFRRSHGLPTAPARLSRADQLELAGEWDAVLAEAEPLRAWALEHGDVWGSWSADLVTAMVRLERGERIGPQGDLVARGRAVGMPSYAAPVAAEAALADGDAAAARSFLADAIGSVQPGELDLPAPFVRACLRCGAPDLARRALAIGPIPTRAHLAESEAAEGMLAEAAGEQRAARERYARAAADLGRLGMAPERAYALAGLGRSLLALGEVGEGIARLREARVEWERIGAPPRVAEIDDLLAGRPWRGWSVAGPGSVRPRAAGARRQPGHRV
jgi:class 3 adenylate cyclase